MIKSFTESQCKMDQAYNNFLGVEGLLKDLKMYCGNFKFVDTDRQFWINDADKIVVMVDIEAKKASEFAVDIMGFGKVALENGADEFNYELVDGTYLIIRMWWD